MPTDSGCAFVVVLHVDPKHESEMPRILGGHTAMPVVQVASGKQLSPDRVYVVAPDIDLKVTAQALEISLPSQPREHRHPVDVLPSPVTRPDGSELAD